MIKQGLTNVFGFDVLKGVHTPQDVYRMALYSDAADLSAETSVYTTKAEVIGQGYGAGGLTLTGYKAVLEGGTASITWNDPMWPNATISARGALIYNYSKHNRALVVLDLGKIFTSTNGDFKVFLPDGTISIGGME